MFGPVGFLRSRYRSPGTGTALFSAGSEMLESRHLGRIPKTGMESLMSQLKAEAFYWLVLWANLKLSAVADGAKANWEFFCPAPMWFCSIFSTFRPASEGRGQRRLRSRHCCGNGLVRKVATALCHDPRGTGEAIDAHRHLLWKGKGGAVDIRRERACFRGNRSRMNYREAANAGFVIGSGAVERMHSFCLPRHAVER